MPRSIRYGLMWLSVGALILLLNGCTLDFKSPVDLIQKPQLASEQRAARSIIDANLPAGAKVVRPLESKNLGSVGIIDWNGDGKDEFYAFYHHPESLEVGLMILVRNQDQWRLAATLKYVGSDIAFAEFIDFNRDGYLDLVLGLSAKDNAFRGISVFEYRGDGRYQEVFKDVYTELRIEDLNMDGQQDLVLFKLDPRKFASAHMVEYLDGLMVQTSEVAMDAFISGYYALQYGKVSDDHQGFVLDFTIGSKSASNILYYDKGSLKLAFDAYDETSAYPLIVKDSQVTARDVDGDGVLELGNRILPRNYYEWSNDPPYLNMWYQWDGADALNLIVMNYIDDTIGYRLDFPDKWVDAALEGKITLIKSRKFMDRHFLDVYLRPEEAVLYKLVSIEVLDKSKAELVSPGISEPARIGETEDKLFTASVLDLTTVPSRHLDQCEALAIDLVTLMSYFSIQ